MKKSGEQMLSRLFAYKQGEHPPTDAPRKRYTTAFLSGPSEHPSVEPFVATSSEHIYFIWKPFFVLSSSSPFVSDVICYNR